MNSLSRTLASFLPVACVLLAAHFLAPRLTDLPASLSGLREYGVYLLLVLGMLVSLAFRRGRVLIALIALALAYFGHRAFLQHGLDGLPARATFAALCIFLPLDLGILSLLRERGTFNWHGVRRLAVLLAQVLLTTWVVQRGHAVIVDPFYAPLLDSRLLAQAPLPQAGMAASALGLLAALAAWFARRLPIDLGFAGAIAAFAIAAANVATHDVYAAFIAAGALILIVAVLQDTFRMAFRDELTALPSRRALNENLAGLGRHYTLAMIDVDHFKKINDVHGHDTGDQVLKMVAAHLAQTGGGSSAYRYGGEEFAVLFPGKSTQDALPYLEGLRKNIADYKMAMRSGDRAADGKAAKKNGGARRAGKTVSVTISIGVAERNERLPTPEDVMQAADKALYRAKRGGRNRINR